MRVLILCAVFLAVADTSPAQESPPLPEDKIAVAGGDDGARAQANAIAKREQDRQKRKQQSAVAGLLLLSVICGAFLFLILLVVFWARRLRQDVLTPLPEQQPVDPLWYLKNAGSEADGTETASPQSTED